MNDIDDVLLRARDSLSGARMDTPVEAILARSRARRRRLAGLSVAGVAASAVLALGLAGVLGSASRTPAHSYGTIRTAAFTLVSNANGTDTLIINPHVLFDPSALQNDLARYGIVAKVTIGSFCSSHPAPDGFSHVVTLSPFFQGVNGQQHVHNLKKPTITIDPSAMPLGTELSVGAFRVANGQDTALALIDTNSYACTSTVPTTSPSGGGLLAVTGS